MKSKTDKTNDEPINRSNWKAVQKYLAELVRAGDYNPKSLKVIENALLKFLIYAGMILFKDLEKSDRVSFPAYVNGLKSERNGKRLEYEYRRKIVEFVKSFLIWLRKKKIASFSDEYIDSMKIREPKNSGWKSEQIAQDSYKYEDMLKILDYAPTTLCMQRAKAAVLFGFLSGIRDGAFVTLPISDVHLNVEVPYIDQMVEHGTDVKNDKNIRTVLLNTPDLQAMKGAVNEWHNMVSEAYQTQIGDIPTSKFTGDKPYPYWFAPISPKTGEIDFTVETGEYRAAGYRKDLMKLCDLAGIEYHRPHTLRHLHVNYAKQFARSLNDMEKIALNIGDTVEAAMHYGKPGMSDITDSFSNMFKEKKDPETGIEAKLDAILAMLGRAEK